MVTTLEGLLPLSKSSFQKSIDVLTRAFWDDPLNAHFFPDETQRQRLVPLFFEYRLKQGRRYGEVFTTSEEVEGIAIWIPSNTIDSTLWREFRSGGFKLLRIFGLSLINRMTKVGEFSSTRRAKYAITPYLHLGSFAVDPEMHGQGFASKLIRPMLAHLDESKMHCYLEAQSESNVSLYEHYGFEVLAEGVVPNTDIPHWDMMRSPQ